METVNKVKDEKASTIVDLLHHYCMCDDGTQLVLVDYLQEHYEHRKETGKLCRSLRSSPVAIDLVNVVTHYFPNPLKRNVLNELRKITGIKKAGHGFFRRSILKRRRRIQHQTHLNRQGKRVSYKQVNNPYESINKTNLYEYREFLGRIITKLLK